MLVLDTNHLCELSYRDSLGVRLRGIDASSEDIVITVVAAEELLKGRLARVAAARNVREQVLSTGSWQILSASSLITLCCSGTPRPRRALSISVRRASVSARSTCASLHHPRTRRYAAYAQHSGLCEGAGVAFRELAGLNGSCRRRRNLFNTNTQTRWS